MVLDANTVLQCPAHPACTKVCTSTRWWSDAHTRKAPQARGRSFIPSPSTVGLELKRLNHYVHSIPQTNMLYPIPSTPPPLHPSTRPPRATRWAAEMPAFRRQQVQHVCEPLLVTLGYDEPSVVDQPSQAITSEEVTDGTNEVPAASAAYQDDAPKKIAGGSASTAASASASASAAAAIAAAATTSPASVVAHAE